MKEKMKHKTKEITHRLVAVFNIVLSLWKPMPRSIQWKVNVERLFIDYHKRFCQEKKTTTMLCGNIVKCFAWMKQLKCRTTLWGTTTKWATTITYELKLQHE